MIITILILIVIIMIIITTVLLIILMILILLAIVLLTILRAGTASMVNGPWQALATRIRPVRLLSIWISQGLTQANS